MTTSKKASFWKRLFALVVDLLLLALVNGLIGKIFDLSETSDYWVSFGLFYAYNIFMDSYQQGTIGKLILRIGVVRIDGTSPSLLNSFFRNFGKIVSALPMFYGFLRILAPHQKQTVHDELGKCLVVEFD